jgi:hypothetical protein
MLDHCKNKRVAKLKEILRSFYINLYFNSINSKAVSTYATTNQNQFWNNGAFMYLVGRIGWGGGGRKRKEAKTQKNPTVN